MSRPSLVRTSDFQHHVWIASEGPRGDVIGSDSAMRLWNEMWNRIVRVTPRIDSDN